jgi:hypothetical protein
VHHVRIQHTGLEHRGKGQRDEDFLAAGAVVAREAEDGSLWSAVTTALPSIFPAKIARGQQETPML